MDSLLDNAKTYITILRNASSPKAAGWKREDFERAVNWAAFFKRVLVRLGKKPAVVGRFNAQLKEISPLTCGQFRQQTITAEFLGNSLDYLIKSLLDNPRLTSDIRELVKEKSSPKDDHHKVEDISQKKGPQCKQPQQSLALLHRRLTEIAKQENGMKRILKSLVTEDEKELNVPMATSSYSLPSLKDSPSSEVLKWLEQNLNVTDLCHHQIPSNTKCIAADSRASTSVVARSQSSLSEDLDSQSLIQKFWSLSVDLLARTAAENLDFFRLLFKLLAARVNHLQTELLEKYKEVCGKMEPDEYLKRLDHEAIGYFMALVCVDERVREVTIDLVKSQVERTSSRTLAIGWMRTNKREEESEASTPVRTLTPSPTTSTKLPVNLWRRILDEIDE